MDKLDLNTGFLEETLTPTKLHPYFRPFIEQQIDKVTEFQKKVQARATEPVSSPISLESSPAYKDKLNASNCSSLSAASADLTDLLEACTLEGSPVSVIGDPAIRQKLLEEKCTLEKRIEKINQLLGFRYHKSSSVEGCAHNECRYAQDFYKRRIAQLTSALVSIGDTAARCTEGKTSCFVVEIEDDCSDPH